MNHLCAGVECAYRLPLEGPNSTLVCAYSLVTGCLRNCPAGRECIHRAQELPKGFSHFERSNRLLNGCRA